MREADLKILYEDNEIIVIDKPAGVAVQTRKLSEKDLESLVRSYLAKKAGGTGKIPYLAVVHRLDQPVAGVVAFAKTQKSAAELSEKFREKSACKTYTAIVCTREELPEGKHTLIDYLLRDGKNNMSSVVKEGTVGAKKAILDYEVESCLNGGAAAGEKELRFYKLRIELKTGRHHQIRVQLSNAGMPIYGDVKYGGEPISRDYRAICELKRGAIALTAESLALSPELIINRIATEE